MTPRSPLPISATDVAMNDDGNASWHTDNYLIALTARGGPLGSKAWRDERPVAKPSPGGSDSIPVVATPASVVADPAAGNAEAFGAPAAVGSPASGDPLTFASLCNLLYDEAGQPPKPDWTAVQWNAALQQQSWTASWRFLAESSGNAQVYFGVAFENADTGQVVVASRGTQTAYDLLVSDLDILRGITPPAFHEAEQFAAQILEALGGDRQRVLVTGHSLGGADAEYQAANLGLAGSTFAALGVKFAASECALDLIDYLYRQDAVANLAPHIGTVVPIAPNGPAQWQDLIATLPFDGEGLHFINNYLEHFGAPGVMPITHSQFVEAVLLSDIANYFGNDPAALARLASAGDNLLPSRIGPQFGFDDVAWPDMAAAGAGTVSTQAGAVGGTDWALAETLAQRRAFAAGPAGASTGINRNRHDAGRRKSRACRSAGASWKPRG